jgi:hypothetical protein
MFFIVNDKDALEIAADGLKYMIREIPNTSHLSELANEHNAFVFALKRPSKRYSGNYTAIKSVVLTFNVPEVTEPEKV